LNPCEASRSFPASGWTGAPTPSPSACSPSPTPREGSLPPSAPRNAPKRPTARMSECSPRSRRALDWLSRVVVSRVHRLVLYYLFHIFTQFYGEATPSPPTRPQCSFEIAVPLIVRISSYVSSQNFLFFISFMIIHETHFIIIFNADCYNFQTEGQYMFACFSL